MAQRQLAQVYDLNKCMGCQTCTVACKIHWSNDRGMDYMWWIKVNTMPGRGSPKDWEKMGGGHDDKGNLVLGRLPEVEDFGEAWEFNYEEVFYGGKGDSVHLAPKKKPTWGPNWDEDVGAGEYPNTYFFYLPRLCNECSRPSCVEACPERAIYKREEDGIILIDEGKCRGHRRCMQACPYKVIYFNSLKGKAQGCHFCAPRIARGVAPACVRQCPGRAVWVDYLDNPQGSVYKLVKGWKVALPLHPEFNNGANIYYIPPLSPPKLDKNGDIDSGQPRIPMDYLHSLFGPGVDDALASLKEEMARRRRGEKSELMDILIARRWGELLGPFQKDPSEVK